MNFSDVSEERSRVKSRDAISHSVSASYRLVLPSRDITKNNIFVFLSKSSRGASSINFRISWHVVVAILEITMRKSPIS